ncbi:hypothetical protein SAMN05216207_11014 [Pseudonocardia ammonioxydans]|uniref:Uncharacterized protein n=1 Tax=Pseudonocardia ammonioxydans TaxID=260086 RepID=A0A1I5IHS2_PSUAM|nr:hypothetical protein SAMN05216207_11014 [Pseudonocardia ammonioxydans]
MLELTYGILERARRKLPLRVARKVLLMEPTGADELILVGPLVIIVRAH